MRKPIAVILASAAAVLLIAIPQIGAAQTESSTAQPITASSPERCTPLKKLYARKRWRREHPLRGAVPCPNAHRRELKESFFLYRHYRQIAPYRCHRGSEGYYAIPCYIVACESHFNWWAMNSSGASYIYQLLGWGAPPPTSFRNRVRNHEIAASLSLSNWVCA